MPKLLFVKMEAYVNIKWKLTLIFTNLIAEILGTTSIVDVDTVKA